MKLGVVVMVLAAVSPAVADSTTDVQNAVQVTLKSFGEPSARGMTATGKVMIDYKELEPTEGKEFGPLLLNDVEGAAKITLGAMTIVVEGSGKTAWFHAPATLNKTALRINGIAVNDGGWKIARIAYASVMPDKELLSHADGAGRPSGEAPQRSGDDAIAKTVATWFDGGFAKGASKSAKLVANGTAPSEFRTGSVAALKLAQAWDKLPLRLFARSIEATAFGKMAFVRVVAVLPKANPNSEHPVIGVEISLAAIVVNEDGVWKWQSLNWAPR